MSRLIEPRLIAATRAAQAYSGPAAFLGVADQAPGALAGAYARAAHTQGEPAPACHGTVDDARNVDVPKVTDSRYVPGALGMGAGAYRSMATADWPCEVQERQVESRWTRWAALSQEALRRSASGPVRSTTTAARSRVERLTRLQAAFGFTIRDLAAVLGVTRPQLYKWLDAAIEVKLQEKSRARLSMIERIARAWSSRSSAPLSSVSHEPLPSGDTLYARMCADVVDEAALLRSFDELVCREQQNVGSRSQRLREAGYARRLTAPALVSDR